MPPTQGTARVNLQEFKAKFVKILGPVKESRYCGLLSSFISSRLTKEELDRLVRSTIGKENVVLHNLFIRAIFTNITCSDPPPSVFDISKPLKGVRRKPSTPLSGGDDSPPSLSPGLQGSRLNGDGFTVSPRKGRSVIRDRKAAERPSPLGNHRGESLSTLQGTPSEDEGPRTLENGHLAHPDLLRPLQPSQYNVETTETWPPSKRARYEDEQVYDGKYDVDAAGTEMEPEEKEDEQDEQGVIWMPSHMRIPLGIPFCTPSAGGPRMAPAVCMPQLPMTHSLLGYALDGDCGETTLPGLESLRQRMQQGAIVEHGLEGYDNESPIVVKIALEIYLQRIIKTVIEFHKSKRSSHREVSSKDNGSGIHAENTLSKDGLQERPINGILAGWNQSREGEGALEGELLDQATVSPLDFYVAMDLNRTIVGENYPIVLEKALLRVFWEQ